jgi:chromosome segregation ATPase
MLRRATDSERKLGDDFKELELQLSHSQYALRRQSQQLEDLNGEHAAKVQEYEGKIKTDNDQFERTRKTMSIHTVIKKAAADKVSAELLITKEQLDEATAKGKELGDEAKELGRQLSQTQGELAGLKQMFSTVTHALDVAHSQIRQLTEVPSGPEKMLDVMVTFLHTHHKAHVTFEQ